MKNTTPIAPWAITSIKLIIAENGGQEAFPKIDRNSTYQSTEYNQIENPELTKLLQPIRDIMSKHLLHYTIANGFNPIELFDDGSVNAMGDIAKQFDNMEDAVAYAKQDETGTLANMLYDVFSECFMFKSKKISAETWSDIEAWLKLIETECKKGISMWKLFGKD